MTTTTQALISKTILIGAGGIGGALAPALARLLRYHPCAEGDLLIVDGDSFEERNQERQSCSAEHLGQNKAEVLTELLGAQGLEAGFLDDYLSEESFAELIKDYSAPLIVTAVDNSATRAFVVNVLSERTGDFLWLSPANSDAQDESNDIRGNVLWFGRLEGEVIGHDPRLLYPNIARPNDFAPRKGACSALAPSFPQLLAANAMAASLALATLQNILDRRIPAAASSCYFNLRSYSLNAS